MHKEASFEPQTDQVKETKQEIEAEASLTEEEKFKKLETYKNIMLRLARSMLFNPADKDLVEDVVQAAYFSAWKNLKTFKHESNLKTWLTKITTNKALDLLRKRRLITEHINPDATIFNNSSNDKSSNGRINKEVIDPSKDFTIKLEQRELFNKLVNKLGTIYKEIIILTVLDDLTIEEAAAKLEISVNAAKIRKVRALEKLERIAKLIKP